MQIIDMIADYQQMVGQAGQIGAFEAYKNYAEKYPELFGIILQGLYMTDLDSLRPMIENVDFPALLKTARLNRAKGLMESVIHIAQRAAAGLDAEGEITLYLGLEMGNIGGFSGDPSRQMLFIGTERPLEETTLQYLVPHEINHMVRATALPDIDKFSFTERVTSEGLGPLYALKFNQLAFTPQNIAKVLFTSEEQAQNLFKATDTLLQELTAHFGEPLKSEHMQQYFTYTKTDQAIVLPGYYIGMVICQNLANADHSVKALTKTPAEQIWQMFLEQDRPLI